MLELGFDYASCVKNSEKVSWVLDEAMPPDTVLDFGKFFLPEPLVLAGEIGCLDEGERRTYNHIASHSYLNLFQFVEEYILATMSQHVVAELFGDHDAIRALCRFVDEEVKHQKLFARYKAAFARDFGHPCRVLESQIAIAQIIMQKSPIAVMLITLHIETMTQQHYTECVRGNAELDPFFSKLLHLHWLEESQHARIDALELDKLLEDATDEQIGRGFSDYLDIVGAFDGLLAEQAGLDVESLAGALGRTFTDSERDEIKTVAQRAYRKTFLTYGMRNPMFVRATSKMAPLEQARIARRAEELDG